MTTATFRPKGAASRALGGVLTVGIVGLALTTGYVHLGLGGLLFTLNAAGYAGLAAAYLVASVAPNRLIASFSWLPRMALAGYAALTIALWAMQGPYFPLAYFAKGVEVALIAAITIDVFRVYGSPLAMMRAAFVSVASLLGRNRGMTASA
jgi:hypothetical protein